jgi:glutathione S-transferase
LLDAHLAGRSYLFGARPAFGDFGVFAQLYEASIDPAAGSIIRVIVLPGRWRRPR